MTKKDRFSANELTTKDKLAILLKTKEILGRGGKNWVQGIWYGKRPVILNRADLEYWEDVPVTERFEVPHRRIQADCFCLEGAVYFAAYQLKYTDALPEDDVAAHRVSLADLIQAKDGCHVSELNDGEGWKTIKQRLDQRIRQVLREVSRDHGKKGKK